MHSVEIISTLPSKGARGPVEKITCIDRRKSNTKSVCASIWDLLSAHRFENMIHVEGRTVRGGFVLPPSHLVSEISTLAPQGSSRVSNLYTLR